MPHYQILHSYMLSRHQKEFLAEEITCLHFSKFTTPKSFIRVSFVATAAASGDFFVAGKTLTEAGNYIIANIRPSTNRRSLDLDSISKDIENVWYRAIVDQDNGSHYEAAALQITFMPIIYLRGQGLQIPEGGQGAAWKNGPLPPIGKIAESGDEHIETMFQNITDDMPRALMLHEHAEGVPYPIDTAE
ncbi:hypothetical protein F5Y18DRAFT_444529 [Xylariaceae sp. FL1019]|nr:hypothetical protein F5Y18DRAFT_444529 [Xylariaceae sp. FL1019]